METIKKLLKITIVLCLVALVAVPIIALSNKPGEKSGLTLTKAKQKMVEITDSTETITNDEEIVLNNIFEDFSSNMVVSNLYHYCYANHYFNQFENFYAKSQEAVQQKNAYLEKAEKEIKKINTNYTGVFSDEIFRLIDDIEETEPVKYQKPSNSKPSSGNSNSNSNGYSAAYNSLTYSDKVDICRFIKNSYEYYDKKEGRDTGDKYSDQIWRDVMKEYGITEIEVTIIWMNSYTNNYLP